MLQRMLLSALFLLGVGHGALAQPDTHTLTQITQGPAHHFYGYIGHVGNTPWNGNGRYMVLLRSDFQDHLPEPEEAADVLLLDTQQGYAVTKVETSRAWNFQQGTMLYWNPDAPDTQFFFNDRDLETGQVFCVLYDIEKRARIREYRFDGLSIGNSGVAQQGGFFLGLNYGRLARLRPVTGYPKAFDWNPDTPHPEDDGIFKIDIATGEKQLLVSYATLGALLDPSHGSTPLFINHTLCSRENDYVYFFARGGWTRLEGETEKPERVNMPFSLRTDGSDLRIHGQHIGGHPEWASGARLIGADGDRQIFYDVKTQKPVGAIATPEILPNPEGDVALSPDGQWLANGYKDRAAKENNYVVVQISTGTHYKLPPLPIGEWLSGDLRIDAAPCWRRDGKAIAMPALAKDGTRQTFVVAWE